MARAADDRADAPQHGRPLIVCTIGARRNQFVLSPSDEVPVLHAAPGSGTERLAHALLAAGQTVLTPADSANAALIAHGATPMESWAAYAASRVPRVTS